MCRNFNRISLVFMVMATFLVGLSSMPSCARVAHEFEFQSIDGEQLPMLQFKGKAVLVVNTASFCGYTPQYEGLQSLWESYKDQGLIVLGVPSNDFGRQEPGSNSEIKDFCQTNFSVNFPMTSKQRVKGNDAHPFFRWASDEKGAPRWNFHKYLLAPDGSLINAYSSRIEPMSPKIRSAIEGVLPKTLISDEH